ncbi:hypothetical protein PENTCL1PPCAC_3140, partial [Pristionchus entomophagus]
NTQHQASGFMRTGSAGRTASPAVRNSLGDRSATATMPSRKIVCHTELSDCIDHATDEERGES